jgi:hypothetical protein
MRLQLDAVASEALSGTLYFEIGGTNWGRENQGGAMGADAQGANSPIKLKNAYLDWTPPNTDLKIRMGLQGMSLPSFTTESMVFQDDTAGVTFSYKFNENVALTAVWARPFNDNSTVLWNGTDRQINANYMDNVDVGALVLPLTFDGVKVTPWVMLAGVGPNFAHGIGTDQITGAPGTSAGYVNAGMLPVGVSRHKSGGAMDLKRLDSYATAVWGGLTGEVTAFDPFRFAWDVNYGSISWPDDGKLNRAGWIASLLFEYKLDWGIPGLYGWYGSGDDDNPANGSERMPVFSVNNSNMLFSNFAFNGNPWTYGADRESVLGNGISGTWGIGIRLKDMTFVEDLKHTLAVNLIGGTNSPDFARRYLGKGEAGYAKFAGNFIGPNAAQAGMDPLYLTTRDNAVEINFRNVYKVYDNLQIALEFDYLFTSFNRDVWKNSPMNGRPNGDEFRDPWNVSLAFAYQF